MPIPPQRWHTIHLDWIEGLPLSQNKYDSILVVVDSATRLTHLIPSRKDSTTMQTAKALIQHVIRLHGFPRVIRTDRDRRITSQVWTDICTLLNIKPTPTVSFHPRANGAVERVNGIISQLLRAHAVEQQDWYTSLSMIEMAINSRSIMGTSYTPYYLTYGFHPTTIADAQLDLSPTINSAEEAKIFVQRMRNDFDKFTSSLLPLRAENVHTPQFSIGDMVLVSFNKRPDPIHENKSKHLRIPWHGPFTITAVYGDCTYKLDLPSSYHVHPVFHESVLRRYISSSPPPVNIPPRIDSIWVSASELNAFRLVNLN